MYASMAPPLSAFSKSGEASPRANQELSPSATIRSASARAAASEARYPIDT